MNLSILNTVRKSLFTTYNDLLQVVVLTDQLNVKNEKILIFISKYVFKGKMIKQ